MSTKEKTCCPEPGFLAVTTFNWIYSDTEDTISNWELLFSLAVHFLVKTALLQGSQCCNRGHNSDSRVGHSVPFFDGSWFHNS